MNRVFKIYGINPMWDIDCQELTIFAVKDSLSEAKGVKSHMQSVGFKKVCIKQRKNKGFY